MLQRSSPLTEFSRALADGSTTLPYVAAESAARANANASHNTYIGFDASALASRSEALSRRFTIPETRPALFGVPVSLKDCFDLAGTVTTCGAKYYAEHHAPAFEDSAVAKRLHASGVLLTGKTHLHPLAYGITGENPDYGDCLQPRDATLLTGGSSSGAAASVQEGSALAAIGTDTGGSIRVPAALCGLAGYRMSHALAYASGPWAASPDGLWAGGAHLAAAFDTVGLLLRDARDAAPLAHVLFGIPFAEVPRHPRVGHVGAAFLAQCDAEPLAAFEAWRAMIATSGTSLAEFNTAEWTDAQEVFAGIQAHEAAALHRGHFDEFEPSIAKRLHWGESLTEADLEPLRQRMTQVRENFAALFAQFDFLMLPCAPVSRLLAGEDQSAVRPRILGYTAPFSLGGLPVIALPGEMIGAPRGTGVQIAAAPGRDAALLAYAAALTEMAVEEQS